MLMWVVAFFTAFLNAGPAAVFFIPVVMHSHFTNLSDVAWWALSLGILAGSSATVTGATAGIVTQTMLEEDADASLDSLPPTVEVEAIGAGKDSHSVRGRHRSRKKHERRRMRNTAGRDHGS